MSKQQFIDQIAPLIQKYAPKYSICVCSPIIAQAILESKSGESALAKEAFNYFGLKYREGLCPTCIGVYTKQGSEQNPDGSYTTSVMKWMRFPNMEAGVQGYFDFTNTKRYQNLKGITDPQIYLNTIKEDGYATSINYVKNLMAVIEKSNLTKYDTKPVVNPNVFYRVQVGAYNVKANAQDQVRKLKKAGFNAVIVEVKKETI